MAAIGSVVCVRCRFIVRALIDYPTLFITTNKVVSFARYSVYLSTRDTTVILEPRASTSVQGIAFMSGTVFLMVCASANQDDIRV